MRVRLRCEKCGKEVELSVVPGRGDRVPVCTACWGGLLGLPPGVENIKAGSSWDALETGSWALVAIEREGSDPETFRGAPIGESEV